MDIVVSWLGARMVLSVGKDIAGEAPVSGCWGFTGDEREDRGNRTPRALDACAHTLERIDQSPRHGDVCETDEMGSSSAGGFTTAAIRHLCASGLVRTCIRVTWRKMA
ncbi:hypothetical protein [Kocuria palustris]|uniref:hypothetical protein n=1 Tax=Kocuria palustris TaxID=71999 RepID=UPI0012E7D69D|nr:hypothetical protein [Kocuria palustris]